MTTPAPGYDEVILTTPDSSVCPCRLAPYPAAASSWPPSPPPAPPPALAACSPPAAPCPRRPPADRPRKRYGGNLAAGLTGGSASDTLDAHQGLTYLDTARAFSGGANQDRHGVFPDVPGHCLINTR